MPWTRFAILMPQELASARRNSRAAIARSASSRWCLNASPAGGRNGRRRVLLLELRTTEQGGPMPEFAQPPDRLAGKLADARQRLAAVDLPRPLAARLHRQFIAVCDAVKTSGADQAKDSR